jgi:hypothetical protein
MLNLFRLVVVLSVVAVLCRGFVTNRAKISTSSFSHGVRFGSKQIKMTLTSEEITIFDKVNEGVSLLYLSLEAKTIHSSVYPFFSLPMS